MHLAVAVVISLLQPAGFHAEFAALFSAHEYRYTGGDYQAELFRYRLFVPTIRDAQERMPLIVWLHGKGEAGPENMQHMLWLEHLIFTRPWKREHYPFFLLAVQCPADNREWTRNGEAPGDDMIHVAKAILEEVLRKQPIDNTRVYLAGISSGGTGCWRLAARFPEYFAAVAPMASNGGEDEPLAALAQIPIWAFHCTRDAGASIEPVRRTVDEVRRAGGKVHLTEVDAASHDCWNPAFGEYHLLDWLLTQRRGAAAPPPGTVFLSSHLQNLAKGWKWWQILVQFGLTVALLAFVGFIVYVQRARIARRRRAGEQPPGFLAARTDS